jgi:predicted RNA binding protein YcfA (HicA-like mRNA interferase family)
MALKDLPIAGGSRHVAAFVHAGWTCVRIKGSHQILERKGVENHLSVPCHGNRDVSRALLDGLIKDAGMEHATYCDHFYRRLPKVSP